MSSAIAASLPATVPLMPSRASSSVPLMPRPQQKAASGCCCASTDAFAVVTVGNTE